MTSRAPILRLVPFFLFAAMALLAWLLHFNGLYGQDAHEYLWQSKAFYANWRQGAPITTGLGNQTLANGYPVLGAALRCVLGKPGLSLQIVSWLAYAAACLLLERLLSLLSHGSRSDSRWAFVLLGLALAPLQMRAGMTVMSDALGLALVLAALFFGLRWVEQERDGDVLRAAVFMALAVSVRIGLACLVAPLALVLLVGLLQRGKWKWAAAMVGTGLAVFALHLAFSPDVTAAPWQHPFWEQWSPGNLFRRQFDTENGVVAYTLPNLLYLFSVAVHPGLCLLLPGLFLLYKKTDLVLPAKQVPAIGMAAYLLLLGGLQHQNPRYLLPAYAVLLLLLFPAWDRMYCYGFYFFRRLTWAILGACLIVQLIGCARILAPVLTRNRLELRVAEGLSALLPAGSTLFGFDLDIALRNYLPDVHMVNLWEKRIDSFPDGSYILFNPDGLRSQWAGKNPMLNWDFAVQNYRLKSLRKWPEGWELRKVDGAEK